jgi:hypothetical protein
MIASIGVLVLEAAFGCRTCILEEVLLLLGWRCRMRPT